MKAGAAPSEPVAVVKDNYYRMNLDKGNQSTGGLNALVLGNIANSSSDCTKAVYEIKIFDDPTLTLKTLTSKDGNLWFVVGTDSGFEATTSLYYKYKTQAPFSLRNKIHFPRWRRAVDKSKSALVGTESSDKNHQDVV